jgi:hypothetical protein
MSAIPIYKDAAGGEVSKFIFSPQHPAGHSDFPKLRAALDESA